MLGLHHRQRLASKALWRYKDDATLHFCVIAKRLTLSRSVIASIIYRSGAIIAAYSYCSKLIDQRYCFYLLSLFHYY